MMLACLALMLIDAICRAKGTKLFGTGVFYLTRFIWFIYGTAVCYVAGMFVPHGYRGFTQDIYHQFQEEIYDAYLGSKWVRVFRNPMKIGDVPVDTNVLIENALFIEVIIILVCRFMELITIKNLKNGNTVSNFLGTFRKVFAIFLALYWWAYAMIWFQNIHLLSKVKALSGKNHFNIGLAWVVAIYVMFETLWSIYEIGQAQVYAFKNKNNTEIQHADAKKKVEESSFSFLDEVAFMYQNKKEAIQNAACAFYNYFFMLRWIFFSFIAITWNDKPRSIYIVFFIVDFLIVFFFVLLTLLLLFFFFFLAAFVIAENIKRVFLI